MYAVKIGITHTCKKKIADFSLYKCLVRRNLYSFKYW